MHTLQTCKIEKAMFISPVLDMEKLICDMMQWAQVNERQLCEKKEIKTAFGETLSWEYLCFVKKHPVQWTVPTEIVYGGQDHLVSRKTVDGFVRTHNTKLTVLPNGEHWFHTTEQMTFLEKWLENALQKAFAL